MTLSPDALVHKTLGGYLLEELIGFGSFAWVYRCRRPGDPEPVAIKVLIPTQSGSLEFDRRFRNEYTVASRLTHPHIVKLHGIGYDQRLTYLVMDFYPRSLAGAIDAGDRVADDALISVGIDIAHALAYAHGRGVVHRDIKPDNIMLAGDGRAALGDFGIARAVSTVTATGAKMTIGTPHYISPEQAQGLAVDGRSDLYSLGVTLYRTATGSLPFRSKDWYELARMHVEDAPQRPRDRRPDLNPDLDRIIVRLLAKHPNDRHPSARALLTDLQAIRDPTPDSPTVTISPGPGPFSASSARSGTHTWLIAAGVALIVVVLIVMAVVAS